MTKHLLKIIAFFTVIISIIGLGLFFYFRFNQNSPSLNQQREYSAMSTAWKTYKNEEYGFLMQYPDNWNLASVELPISGNPKIIPRFEFRTIDNLPASLEVFPVPSPVLKNKTSLESIKKLFYDPFKPYGPGYYEQNILIGNEQWGQTNQGLICEPRADSEGREYGQCFVVFDLFSVKTWNKGFWFKPGIAIDDLEVLNKKEENIPGCHDGSDRAYCFTDDLKAIHEVLSTLRFL